MTERSTRTSHVCSFHARRRGDVSPCLFQQILACLQLTPALDRDSQISKFSYGQFAVVEATEAQSMWPVACLIWSGR